MIPFDYRRAEDVLGAVTLVREHENAAFLGGGTNLVDHLRLGVAAPELLVDVSRLPLDRVEPLPGDGVRIGASVRNSDLAAHPLVRRRYPVLSQALLSGASGQIRNLATTAGNLLQRTRCVYFRDVTTPCDKREPGSGCSALEGYNRYHAVLGASPHCVAVHPSDLAVALVALDAVVHVRGPDAARTIRAEDLHRLPGDEPHRDTVLAHGELITAVDVPDLPFAVHSR
ncbi:FAD binding domain-containing protein, partial [Actinophytocola sp.]|uniref:FAD binding domain-containing protein n=1 Tax=Actinophytocola sp. TaxID=1872138 RepID=UPI00389A819C